MVMSEKTWLRRAARLRNLGGWQSAAPFATSRQDPSRSVFVLIIGVPIWIAVEVAKLHLEKRAKVDGVDAAT